MIDLRLNAVIGDDRKLIVQLPDDIPLGEVEIIIRSSETTTVNGVLSDRQTAKSKLMRAGALVTDFDVPTEARRLSVEERMQIGTLPNNARSSLDLINDDRGEW